jgi:hypothetical protein
MASLGGVDKEKSLEIAIIEKRYGKNDPEMASHLIFLTIKTYDDFRQDAIKSEDEALTSTKGD